MGAIAIEIRAQDIHVNLSFHLFFAGTKHG